MISTDREWSGLDRHEFIKRGAQATIAAAASKVLSICFASGSLTAGKEITLKGAIPTRVLGKSKAELPIQGHGGAVLPRKWGNTLATSDRVKLVRRANDSRIRRFDTAISYTYDDSLATSGEAVKDVCERTSS